MPVPAAAAPDDSGSETILLVEDEDEVRRVLHQILAARATGSSRRPPARRPWPCRGCTAAPIDLLLTDVTMPQMKGPELAARLLAERPQTRVLFMSGYNEESLSGRARPICLQKPFSAQTLTQTIRAILDAEESLPKSATA